MRLSFLRDSHAGFAEAVGEALQVCGKALLARALFPVDRSRHSPYVPRNFEGGILSPRERVAQPVEQLTFNQ